MIEDRIEIITVVIIAASLWRNSLVIMSRAARLPVRHAAHTCSAWWTWNQGAAQSKCFPAVEARQAECILNEFLTRRHWWYESRQIIELKWKRAAGIWRKLSHRWWKIVNSDEREMTFSGETVASVPTGGEGPDSTDLARRRSPGLSCSATAASLCSTMSDGVAPSQLDGNESDWRGCSERLPKIMFCVCLALHCLLLVCCALFNAVVWQKFGEFSRIQN